jgi:hypothetical protein
LELLLELRQRKLMWLAIAFSGFGLPKDVVNSKEAGFITLYQAARFPETASGHQYAGHGQERREQQATDEDQIMKIRQDLMGQVIILPPPPPLRRVR